MQRIASRAKEAQYVHLTPSCRLRRVILSFIWFYLVIFYHVIISSMKVIESGLSKDLGVSFRVASDGKDVNKEVKKVSFIDDLKMEKKN